MPRNLVGPVLTGVIGRQSGTAPGFAYSALNKAAGENGLVWTDDLIMQYLPDPNAFLKKFLTDKGKADLATGSTKMAFKLGGRTAAQGRDRLHQQILRQEIADGHTCWPIGLSAPPPVDIGQMRQPCGRKAKAGDHPAATGEGRAQREQKKRARA